MANEKAEERKRKAKEEAGIVTANDKQAAEINERIQKAFRESHDRAAYEAAERAAENKSRPVFHRPLSTAEELAASVTPGYNTVFFADEAAKHAGLIGQAIKYKQPGAIIGNTLKTGSDLVFGVTSLYPIIGSVIDPVTKNLIPRQGYDVKVTSSPSVDKSVATRPAVEIPVQEFTPNYQGDHLALVKERLANGGYERIGNSPLSKETLLETPPTEGNLSQMKARLGEYYDTARKPTWLGDHLTDPTERAQFISNWDHANDIYTAHEFEHFVHEPIIPLPEDAIYSDLLQQEWIRPYFEVANNTELAARFGQLKNYFGLKEGEQITPEMWRYAQQHYIADTGVDNNMSAFFNLPIRNLKSFLNWGNENALSVIPTVIGTGVVLKSTNSTPKQGHGGKLNYLNYLK